MKNWKSLAECLKVWPFDAQQLSFFPSDVLKFHINTSKKRSAQTRWFHAWSKYWHEPSHIFQARVLDSSACWSTRSPCNQTSNQFNTLKLKAVLWWGTAHSLTTHWIRDRMYPVQTFYITTKELPKLLKSAILCLCSQVSSCHVSIILSFPLSNNSKNDTSGHFSQLRQRHTKAKCLTKLSSFSSPPPPGAGPVVGHQHFWLGSNKNGTFGILLRLTLFPT